jgi:RHS repeat-associated protein
MTSPSPKWMLSTAVLFLLFATVASATAPTISSLNPTSGAVGATVVISGSNFGSSQGSSTVKFNGTAATATAWGATSITATVPSGATTGNVVVTVSNKASNGVGFSVVPAPGISSLSINSGAVGAALTITGSNFGSTQGSTAKVAFNGATASVTSWATGSIAVTVPSGATTGNVVVYASGVNSNGINFTVVSAPSITSLSIPTGAVGAAVTIAGSNFGSTQINGAKVSFNGITASVTSWATGSISVTVPSGATTGNVVVFANGVNSNGANFTVVAAPSITSLSVTSGPVGTSMTISGTNFGSSQGSSSATFNGTTASVTSWASGSIAVTVPSGATTGNVVVFASGVNSNGVNFTVIPHITSLSTASGAVGAAVTITGTSFGSAQGSSTVTFNGATATPTSWSATTILVPIPSGATTGNVIVTVSNQASNGVSFTILPTPSITSVSPTSGTVGSLVTISGANFGASQGSGTVTFNGTIASVSSWSASSISVSVPSGASTGNVIVFASGVNSNGAPFTVENVPQGWVDGDVGPGGAMGSASYSNDAFTVKSAGNGVGAYNGNNATIDGFHFVYQQLSGDGSIAARITSLQGGWAVQAGVMIRETLDQSSANEFLSVDQTASLSENFWNRTSAGGSESYTKTNGLSGLPIWLKLVRQSNNFTAYTSPDGINWLQYGTTATISMAQSVYIGIVCAGQNNGSTLGISTFDNVSVSSSALPAPAITGVSATTGPIGSQIVITGSGFGSNQGSSLVTLNASPVTVNTWSATSITITIPTGAASGHLVVSVAPSMNDSNPVEFTITGNPLPGGWFDSDIGPAGAMGTATYSNRVFTLNSAGTGVGGVNGSSTTVDGFHFVYQPLSGDGEIVARITGLQSGGWASQAGLMIRESLDEQARNVFLADNAIGSPTLYLYDRTTPASAEASGNTLGLSYPYWLKLIRSGSTFAAYTSPDAINWTQLNSNINITMAQNVYIGLACSGGNNGSSITSSTLDYVSVTSTTAPGPVIGQLSATTGTIGTQIVLTGSGFGATQGSSFVTLNGVSVSINSWSATSITITIPATATTGYLVVTVAPSMNNSNGLPFEVTSSPLPSGWSDQDVGAVGKQGGATYSNGVFTVQAAGYGVGGTSSGTFGGTQDSFHFVYQPMVGDGSIVARVVSAPGTTGQAGVVIREKLEDLGSVSALSTFFPQNTDAVFADRTTEGAHQSVIYSSAATPLPTWVKVVRGGNNFSAYASADASNWVQLGATQTIIMAQNAYVGLAVSSGNTASLTTVTFDNVSVSSTQNPAPVITGVSSTNCSVGGQVVISGSGFGETQGNSQVLLNDSAVTINSWNTSSISITIPVGATSGPLVVSVAPELNDSNGVQITITQNPLPSGWLDQDVGLVGVAGNASYSSGTFTINGAGSGVGGTGGGYGGPQDSFHFVYQPLAGNGTIIARILTDPGSAGQAGIMIRQGLDTGSLNALLANFPQDGGAFIFERTSTGSNESSPFTGAAGPLPYWVKLVRNGASFTFFTSADGSTWTQDATSQSIPMSQNVYVGLGMSSGIPSSLVSATFDNVSVNFGGWGASPTISNLSPSSGAFGASVTITGSNFGATQGTSTVTFNGTPATPCGTCWTSTSITVNVPSGATTGNLFVNVGGVNSNGVTFGVFNPSISAISPPAAQASAIVTLNGSGFGSTPYRNQVQFNGVSGNVISWNDASITVQVPSNATSGPVTVIEGGVTSNSVQFSVETLSVTGISPALAAAGAQVAISGTGFGSTQANSTVDFNGTVASVQSWSDTQIVAIVPKGTVTGSVNVTVGTILWYGPVFTIGQSIQVTDSKTNTSTYTLAMIGGLWQATTTQGSGCSTCTERGNISYSFDSSGRVLTATDENGNTTSYSYDSIGNLLTKTVPINPGHTATTTYTYNSFGEVLTATDPLLNVTTNTYDANGNLLTVTTPAPGNGASASITRFAYDSKGELTRITDPLGNQTNIAYFPTGMIQTITDAQSNVTAYAYDLLGNRTSVTDANNKQTTFAYDAMNRLTKITYPDTTTTQFGYDIRGRRTSVTDQNSKTTTYAYDDADRLITVTDAATNATTYGYDSENNLTSIKDANNNSTTFDYDNFRRVTTTHFPSGSIEQYGYDNVGNLTSKTDRKNQQITYTYDQLNRLTLKTYPDTTTVNYTYDNDSRLTQVSDPTGTYQFTFDNMGRLTGTTSNYAFLTGRNFVTSYGYDAASNRTTFVDPENGSTSYGYDTLNRLQTLTPPAAISGGSFGFGYDALSRRTSLTRPNSVNTGYSYDNLSRLLSVTHAKGGVTLDGATYTLDNAGNRNSKADLYAGVTTNYGYDNIYELLSATQGTNTTESYTYDPVGNRLSNLSGSGWSNNTSNELTSRPGVTYTYDNNGNTLTKTDSTGTATYAWDFENRMTSVTLPGSGGTVTFKYDPFGRRIYQSSPSGTSIYAYDANNLVEETNGTGAVVARYTQGEGIDEPLATLRSSTTSYYEQDGLGSVTSLSNSAGALAQTYTFDSFGNMTGSGGSLTNPFQFTGREFDTGTSVYYYRRRYYDQGTGRFLSEDPVRFAGGKNFYRYVGNGPVTRKDPLGLWQGNIGGGLGLGAMLTIGKNGGQWNFGLYTGIGVDGFIDFDPTDSGGCRKFGAYGSTRVHAGLGLKKDYGSVDITFPGDGSAPSGEVEVNLPPVGGISWSPTHPIEPPHGVLGVGDGGFGGVGFTFSSPPTQCGCE